MKKTKFIALALIVAMALTGAGYAYWTETLKVEATVKTGQLDFQFRDASIPEGEMIRDIKVESITTDNNGNNQDNTQLNLSLADVYPGAYATIRFKVFNNSTMQTQLTGFNLNETDYDDYIFISRLIVDGTNLVGENPINISELDETLNNHSIVLDPFTEVPFELKLEVAGEDATEETFPENLGRLEGLAPIVYTLEATGRQWNDNRGQQPVDPEPQEPVKTPLDRVTITSRKIDNFNTEFTAHVEPKEAEDTASYQWKLWCITDIRTREGEWIDVTGANSKNYVLKLIDIIEHNVVKVKVVVTGSGDYEGTVEAEVSLTR